MMQMVWGRTTRVGCGLTGYRASGGYHAQYYVCNYGESGNVLGREVYRRGPACSACPTNTRCSHLYPGLCV